MNERLRIAGADATKKTAQDAPGTIFSRGVATLVSPLFRARVSSKQSVVLQCHLNMFARSKTAWTLSSLWTHKTRPQVTLKTAQTAVFNSAHTDHLFLGRKRRRTKNERQNHTTNRPRNRIRANQRAGRESQRTKISPSITHSRGWCTVSPRTRIAVPTTTIATPSRIKTG